MQTEIRDVSQSAERMRLLRNRQKRGAMLVTLEVEVNEIDALVADDWLANDRRDDRAAVEAAVCAVISASLEKQNARPASDGRVRVVFNLTPASVQLLIDAGFLEAGREKEPYEVREAFRAAAEAGCESNASL